MIELTSRPGTTLDRAAIERLIATCGDADMLVTLLDTLFDDAPQLLANLRRAVLDGDHDGARLAAHTLKSHAMIFGAPLLAHVAQDAERRARDRDLAGASALLDELEEEYRWARRALRALRMDLAKPSDLAA